MKPSLCSKRRVKIRTRNQKSGARLINQGFFEPSTTLQLNEDTIVTQTAATKYQKTVLDYTGANDAAVEEKFRQLTGLTGPLDEAKVYEGSDGIVYTVEMPNQTVTLRTVSSSGKDWTIDLKNPLSNGVKRIKFSR